MRVFLKTVKFFRSPGCGSGASLLPQPYAGRHFLTRSRSPGVLLKIGHGEEWAAAVYPAPCLQDGAGTSVEQVKRAIAIKSIGPGTARYIRPDVSADARLCGRGSNRTLPPVAMSRRLACHHGYANMCISVILYTPRLCADRRNRRLQPLVSRTITVWRSAHKFKGSSETARAGPAADTGLDWLSWATVG